MNVNRLMVNELAKTIKQNGMDSYVGKTAWGDLVKEMYPLMETLSEKAYHLNKESIRVGKDSFLSCAMYEAVMYSIRGWNPSEYDFTNTYINYTKKLFKTIARNNGYKGSGKLFSGAVSLDEESDEGGTLAETLKAPILEVDVIKLGKGLSRVFALYREKFGEDKEGIARILFNYADEPSKRTEMVLKFYEEPAYNPKLRKRVQYEKERFQKFCREHSDVILGTL